MNKVVDDLEIKIGTKEEQAWTQQLERVEQAIINDNMNLDIAKAVKELCENKLKEIELAK